MGNSCKRVEKDDKAKKHFKNNKNNKNEDEKPIPEVKETKIKEEKIEFKNDNINKIEVKNKNANDVEPKIENIKNEPKIENINNNIEIKKENINKIEENIEIKKEIKEEKKIEKKKEEKKPKPKGIDDKNYDVNNFTEEEYTCNLKLEISLKNLPDEKEYNVELYEYKNIRKLEKKKIGQTGSKNPSEDKSIQFDEGIIIPFHFSQNQPLEFIIKASPDIIVAKSLGEIVGSLRQTYRQNVEKGISFEVKAILNDELNREISFDIQISGNLTGMKIGYSITSLGNQYDPVNNLVYESEILDNNSKITFNNALIPLNELAEDNNLEDNLIEINFKDVMHSNDLGKFKSSIMKLFENDIDFDLKGNAKAKIVCRRKNFHSLLDYLERDLHLSTTLFIDFSEIGENNTHHKMDNNETIFEKLMNNFTDILVPYNEEPFFHIYGFGFKEKEKFKGDYEPYMFPINKKIGSPSIKINEIKKFYDAFINSIDFGKQKTDIDLIVKKFNDIVKEDIDDYDINEYNTLLIFSNNDIFDEKAFVKDLIISSSLPMSIVIVGLGKGPFTKLENIEQQFLTLRDDEGNKPERKCFRFVSFAKNSKNFQSTAKNSLFDIPEEMVEYLGMKNIEPRK